VKKRGKFELGDQVVSESGSTFGRIIDFAPGVIFVEDHWHHDPDGPGPVRHRAVTNPDLDAPDGAVVDGFRRSGDTWVRATELLDDDGVWVDTGVPARPEQKT
jgi:hypothetical protein